LSYQGTACRAPTSGKGGTHTSREGGAHTSREGGAHTSREGGTHTSREGGAPTSREGGVAIDLPDSKGETDCDVTLATEQWYAFSLEINLDDGAASLYVDDAATQCAALVTPFDGDNPIQGFGFAMPDDLVGGVTYIGDVEVLGFEEPAPDDDDDDSDDDDDDDDDDDTTGVDDDDDDDDDGCCGC